MELFPQGFGPERFERIYNWTISFFYAESRFEIQFSQCKRVSGLETLPILEEPHKATSTRVRGITFLIPRTRSDHSSFSSGTP